MVANQKGAKALDCEANGQGAQGKPWKPSPVKGTGETQNQVTKGQQCNPQLATGWLVESMADPFKLN